MHCEVKIWVYGQMDITYNTHVQIGVLRVIAGIPCFQPKWAPYQSGNKWK